MFIQMYLNMHHTTTMVSYFQIELREKYLVFFALILQIASKKPTLHFQTIHYIIVLI